MTTDLEKKGEEGDTVLCHLTLGEIVLPRAVTEDTEFRAMLAEAFRRNGMNLRQFIVGDPSNKINSETGYREFGWFKKIFKSFKSIFSGLLSVFSPQIPEAPPLPPPPKAAEPIKPAAPAQAAQKTVPSGNLAGGVSSRTAAATAAVNPTGPRGLVDEPSTAKVTLLGGSK